MSDVGHATGQSVGTFRDPGFSISLVAYPHVVQPLQPICKLLVQSLRHPLCRPEGQGRCYVRADSSCALRKYGLLNRRTSPLERAPQSQRQPRCSGQVRSLVHVFSRLIDRWNLACRYNFTRKGNIYRGCKISWRNYESIEWRVSAFQGWSQVR